MMPYTQISNYGGNQLPPSLYFDGDPSGGSETGDPGGGSAGGGKRKAAPKKTKKAAPKAKKKR
jgi:hypothetical protein